MGYLEYFPSCFVLLLALMWCRFGVLHLVREVEKRGLDVVEAIWGGFLGGASADGRHGNVLSDVESGYAWTRR